MLADKASSQEKSRLVLLMKSYRAVRRDLKLWVEAEGNSVESCGERERAEVSDSERGTARRHVTVSSFPRLTCGAPVIPWMLLSAGLSSLSLWRLCRL